MSASVSVEHSGLPLGASSPAGTHVWAIADQALVSVANFLTTIALTRLLGLDGFGVYALAWMAALFVNGLLIAGVVSPMLSIGPRLEGREAADYYGGTFLQAALYAWATTVLLYAAVLVAAAVVGYPALGELAGAIAVASGAFQLQDFLRRYFIARRRLGDALISDGISYAGQLGVLVWAFGLPAFSVAQALWTVAATSLLAVAIGILRLGDLTWSRRHLGWAAVRNWRSGKWLVGSVLVQWLSGNQVFTITAASIFGAGAAGVMRASQNIVGVMHVLYQGLENVIPAEAARLLRERGRAALLDYIERITLVAGGTAIVVLAVLFTGAELWQQMIYGEEMARYAFVLRWYAAIYLVVFFGTPLRAYLRAYEHTSPIFWASVASMTFSLAAAVMLTTTFGLEGAMLGVLLSFVVLNSMLAFGAFRRRGHDGPLLSEGAA